MSHAIDKLAKILVLERSQGCANRAVIGGLEAFLRHWRHDAAGHVTPGLVTQVSRSLDGYSALSVQDRRQRLDRLERSLASMADPASNADRSGGADGAAAPRTRSARQVPSSPPPAPTSASVATDATPRTGSPESGAGGGDAPTSETVAASGSVSDQRGSPTPPSGPLLAPGVGEPDVAGPPRPGSGEAAADPEVTGPRVSDHPDLGRPLFHLRGFGVKSAERLERLGVTSIRDLLFHAPARYEDFRAMTRIGQLKAGDTTTVIGTVIHTRKNRVSGGRVILRVTLGDTTGRVTATFFNQPWLEKEFRRGRQMVLSGRVGRWSGRAVFVAPAWEPVDRDLVHTARLVPVYPLTEGLHQRWLRHRIARAVEEQADLLGDSVPAALREAEDLPSMAEAVRTLHAPDTWADVEEARRRIAFDELLDLQLWSLQRRAHRTHNPGVSLAAGSDAVDQLVAELPFELTGAQRRVLDEICGDLVTDVPMSRLLQGDVGCGKTIVAAAACAMAVAAGYQAVIMAPTEILADQHFESLCRLLAPLGFVAFDPFSASLPGPGIARLVGSMSSREKEAMRAAIGAGAPGLVVGTHAVIQETVTVPRLGLSVVDEQHRFGVLQRAELRRSPGAVWPHQLIMTATPIPRTLSLVLNADLDQSVIDELPPGRRPVETVRMTAVERERAYHFLRHRVQQGEQAFIICPLVEESDRVDAPSAVEEHARLSREVLPDLRVGLLHGRLSGAEKEATMRAFRRRELDVLVATTVIEVGVDVPNATVMLIDGADRFGLAQLHQLRGRVGRGEKGGWCLLLADEPSETANRRLDAMVDSTDGLELAALDLEIRGPGDYFGLQQSGDARNLQHVEWADLETVRKAHRTARRLLEADPDLADPAYGVLRDRVEALREAAERT